MEFLKVMVKAQSWTKKLHKADCKVYDKAMLCRLRNTVPHKELHESGLSTDGYT